MRLPLKVLLRYNLFKMKYLAVSFSNLKLEIENSKMFKSPRSNEHYTNFEVFIIILHDLHDLHDLCDILDL